MKLGPLASTDLCAGVKGLLKRLITHFGLGSSEGEEPCRVLCLLGEDPAFLGSIVLGKCPFGNSTVLLRDLADLPRGYLPA